jgi:hypothetical protein
MKEGGEVSEGSRVQGFRRFRGSVQGSEVQFRSSVQRFGSRFRFTKGNPGQLSNLLDLNLELLNQP